MKRKSLIKKILGWGVGQSLAPNWWQNKTIVLSDAYGSAKVRLNKCAALAARFWTIYLLTPSNSGSVAFEKRREIRQGGRSLMQWSWDTARLTRPMAR